MMAGNLLVLLLCFVSSQSFTFNTLSTVRSNELFYLKYDRRIRKQSSLQMNLSPAVNTGMAITGAITGGFFAGGLHAVSGPDHLAALLPKCIGQTWFRAVRVGVCWGVGHGISSLIIGISAFALKNRLNNVRGISKILGGANHLLELAVGACLIMVGLMGIHEAREWEEENKNLSPRSLSAAAVDPHEVLKSNKRTVVLNGILHGFSWDGAPSLAPALAVSTWRGNFAFLLSYGLGTMGAMALATTLVGEGTRKAGEIFNRPDIPQKLSLASSFFATLIGITWIGVALI